MPFCSKCGAQVGKGDLFCSKCGAKLGTQVRFASVVLHRDKEEIAEARRNLGIGMVVLYIGSVMVTIGAVLFGIYRTEYGPLTITHTHPYRGTGIVLQAIGGFLFLVGVIQAIYYDQKRKRLLKK
jgi:hypothetical protein